MILWKKNPYVSVDTLYTCIHSYYRYLGQIMMFFVMTREAAVKETKNTNMTYDLVIRYLVVW